MLFVNRKSRSPSTESGSVDLLQLFYDRLGVARDRQLLVCRDNGNGNSGIVSGDKGSVAGSRVDFLIQLHARKRKVINDCFTQSGLILAQSCGEYDTVTAAHRDPVLTDILCDLIVQHLVNKSSAVIALFLSLGDVTVVGRNARYA